LFALQGKQEWLDLKDGWPEYIDEMDRMFAGVAVTGETAYVPGASRHLNFISSGDEEETAEFETPQSSVAPLAVELQVAVVARGLQAAGKALE
jgi:hypothetical protein